mmetsp:Transcript_1976/g.2467  ORF Transcript_1976/g.2467 Transcript_1976/m.2467 type:complete len:238 (-) Transcript_1976:287-1000(-)|eukprot:CAMPEP_0172499498 /NCGR_PEP_ID=MMETSP1066-20121228/128114_1 /TAXON_ID=671091 /ORGANISM="Coscinodiscus wailesii, Strain CCMP2513" /LENGTH=237 /DNA_ID=CAMNT_0013273277 /DNA_START=406 /DNA_END=1119 /DNA_ORIENTATION=-
MTGDRKSEQVPLPPPPPASNGLPSTTSSMKSGSLPSTAITFQPIGSKPTLISVPPMRFLIMDAPRQSNLHLYIRECSRHGVTDIVRVCEPTYVADNDLRNAGIELHEMAYDDGTSPPKEILEKWLDLVHRRFYGKAAKDIPRAAIPPTNAASAPAIAPVNSTPTIAVHCVAGLGRAPVLVAISLVEFKGMDPVDAVSLIRSHRRGAINEKQLNYLEKYRKWYKKGPSAEAGCACVIL